MLACRPPSSSRRCRARWTRHSRGRPMAKPCTSCQPTPPCWPFGRSWSGAAMPHTTGSSTMPESERFVLTLGHLYPDQLNVYGDRGNILTFQRRCAWRSIALRIVGLDLGEPVNPTEYDLLFIG